MPTHFPVHHPLDPATPSFDFWGWRIYRRLLIDRLLALSGLSDPLVVDFAAVADAFEAEQAGEEELATLTTFLESRGRAMPQAMHDLFLAFAEIAEDEGVMIPEHWDLPAIVPDWKAIPVSKAVFVGTIDGVSVRARLPESRDIVPPYEVIWSNRHGVEMPPENPTHPIGTHVPYGRGMWDWLFTRRLTLLCQAGAGEWPDPEGPPIVLPSNWRLPGRPF